MPFLTKEKKELTELDKLKTVIEKNPYLTKENKAYLVKCNPESLNMGDDINYSAFITTIISNKNLCNRKIEEVIDEARNIYTTFELYGYSFNHFLKLFIPSGIYEKGIFSIEVLSQFERVENYYLAMNMLISHDISLKNFKETKRLITSLGIYTPNDIELNSMLSHFLTTANFAENYQDLVDIAIDNAKKRAGVYDNLSDDYLAKMEMLVNRAIIAVDSYKEEEKQLEDLRESLRVVKLDVKKAIKAFQEEVAKIDETIGSIATKHNQSLDGRYLELYVKLEEDFRKISKEIVNIADTEAKRAAISSVQRMEESAQNLASIENQYKEKTTTEMADIKRITEIATEQANKCLEEMKSMLGRLKIDESIDLSQLSKILNNGVTPNIIVPNQTILTPTQGGIVQAEDVSKIEVPKILKCFDGSIAFQERLKMMLDRKEKFISEGVVYNKIIDDCIYFILHNFYPYLYGPSGAGKNYFVKQLAELFELPVANIGYITEECDIVGGKTAHGAYSPSNFYNCWLNGYFGFANEFDNSIASAAIKLGEFMDAEPGEEYSFPGLRVVKRHPNCRIIAAGNTTGSGFSRTYNARQKFDESLQQRFKFMKFDFDPNVERKILEDHLEWYDFAVLFREALDSYWKGKNKETEGQITTRDFRDIRTEIEDDFLKVDKIFLYEFIETKDRDCLATVFKYMDEKSDKDAQFDVRAKALVKKFGEAIEGK